MSLKSFHRVFVAFCLALCAFLGWWASGHNASAQVTPWLQVGSVLGAAGLAGYLYWHLRAVRLPA